ncbi:hypothetical protein EBY67_01375, partial [bacterium]|nr:hypothetical protein [bacterium]
DPKSEEEITLLLSSLAQEKGRLVLLVTHSLRFLDFYDSVTILSAGRLVYSADPRDLTSYFNVSTPEDIYPALAKRDAETWAEEWVQLPHPPELTPSTVLGELESEMSRVEKESSFELPSFLSQSSTWFFRRLKLFMRDPAQVFLQLSLLLVFPAVVTLFAYRGLPSVRNMAMSADGGVLDQLRETLAFTLQSSRIGTLVSGLAMFQVILLALMGSNNSAREVIGDRPILEKEKLAGLRPGATLFGMSLFLSLLVLLQSAWMTLFVRAVCQFPGNILAQFLPFFIVTAAITSLCLAISSWTSSSEQASLGSLYLVGFQLPLSGAILALPDSLGTLTRPLISAYWAWSGYLQTLRETRFYDLVRAISETPLASYSMALWILLIHLGLGLRSMARRAHPTTPSKPLFFLVLGFLAFAGVGAYFFQKDANPYRTVEKLIPSDYYENANSLRGNVYQIEGTILNSLAWNPEKGRLFSIRVTTGDSKNWPLPILIPSNLRQINIQKNQSYRAKVRINDSGILLVEEVQKS